MLNRQFRWDYWVRNAREMKKKERESILQEQRYLLAVPASEISLQVTGALGESDLEPEIYRPILELMADYQPRTLRQIEGELQGKSIKFSQIYQAIIVLLGKSCIELLQDEERIARTREQTRRLNAFLCNQAKTNNDIPFLSSPLTDGDIGVNQLDQLFLEGIKQDRKEPPDWAEYA